MNVLDAIAMFQSPNGQVNNALLAELKALSGKRSAKGSALLDAVESLGAGTSSPAPTGPAMTEEDAWRGAQPTPDVRLPGSLTSRTIDTLMGSLAGAPQAALELPRALVDTVNSAGSAMGDTILGMPGAMVKSTADMVSGPERAINGEMSRDEMGKWAAETAMNLMGMGAPIPKPKNALSMFGGIMAQNADHAALDVAKKMAKDGATRDEIRDATGWFKGRDDKWRFEIDDSKAAYEMGDVNDPNILASRSANIYDPPVKSPRPFEADYPAGAPVDDAGRLVADIEGRPLNARYVVGRTEVGGNDLALPSGAYDEIAKAGTGTGIIADASQLSGRDVGHLIVERHSGKPKQVVVSDKLSPAAFEKVASHEIGHLIDELARQIPDKGIKTDLAHIYNTLNTGQERTRNLMGPQHVGYKGEDVSRELMAEAIRAYMTDPNYIKTVAPDVAARIRKFVNANPKLNSVVQFNMGQTPIPALFGAMKGDDKAGYSTGGGF